MNRLPKWTKSDLVGIPVTVVGLAVLALGGLGFVVFGPLAGIVVALALIGVVAFIINSQPKDDLAEVHRDTDPRSNRILVVADRGLERADLTEEIASRCDREPTEVHIIAPVTAGSKLEELADDMDEESEAANRRVDAAVARIRERGIEAGGRVANERDPVRSIIDGMREFPPDEVILVAGPTQDLWPLEDFADRLRSEVGVSVTELE